MWEKNNISSSADASRALSWSLGVDMLKWIFTFSLVLYVPGAVFVMSA